METGKGLLWSWTPGFCTLAKPSRPDDVPLFVTCRLLSHDKGSAAVYLPSCGPPIYLLLG